LCDKNRVIIENIDGYAKFEGVSASPWN